MKNTLNVKKGRWHIVEENIHELEDTEKKKAFVKSNRKEKKKTEYETNREKQLRNRKDTALA